MADAVASGAVDFVGFSGYNWGYCENTTWEEWQTDDPFPRASVSDWEAAGRQTIWDRARQGVADILAGPPPDHLDPGAEARIRARFPIKLPAIKAPE